MITAIWEGEMPIKCVPACAHTHGVKLHFLSPCHCCARDVGSDRSGWKMWSLFPSSSSSSSSPTTSLKIAGRERRQQSRGSIYWSASGFNTPTTSTRRARGSPLNHTSIKNIISQPCIPPWYVKVECIVLEARLFVKKWQIEVFSSAPLWSEMAF